MKQFFKNTLRKFRNNAFPLKEIDLNRPISVQKILWDEARHESASFCKPHMSNALLFDDDDQLQKFVISKILKVGNILEFGVYQAHSLNLPTYRSRHLARIHTLTHRQESSFI